MEGYVITTHLITTHLIDNPKITFFYKGTANEEGVSLAMNTIVGFDVTDAKVFQDKEEALQLCEKLNEDAESLLKKGYGLFSIQYHSIPPSRETK